MLLTSIMVTSVFSVALTVKTGGSKGERKLKAAAGARQISALLKNFVTGDPLSVAAGFQGPGVGANKWSMTGGGVVDACACPACVANCYALAQGSHTLTGVLPASFEGGVYNARVIYFVDATTLVNGRPVPAVSITTTWTDP